MSIWKKDDFSSLTQPVASQLELPEPTNPDGVFGKAKSMIVTTGKMLGAGVVMLGLLVLDDDDCDRDRDREDKAFASDP